MKEYSERMREREGEGVRRREEGRKKKGKGVENDELNWMEEVMRKRKERVRRIDSETGEREGEKEKGDETRKKKKERIQSETVKFKRR